ncbi:NAC domain-containing protein 69-like [Mangifera indica]|uniref:NAC domain-containing protein 69-like n=1 Tax=Mangifera indica TaxID=29780 RepID=UPI001CFBC7F0|nr:NAC domain-containing protein 69-like [Mangifera indica]
MGSLVGLMYHFFRVKIITLLAEKRVHPNFSVPGINEVDIYQFDPSDLPTLSETNSDDQVWYFFVEPYYKYAKSKRVHRATGGGYWKITGKGCDVKDKGQVIGSKKTLVFCRRGATSKETETDWVMHEFYVKDSPQYEKNFVVCYIEKKRTKKSSVSTPDDGQPSLGLSSDFVSHVTENPSSEVR